jgi:hypothetical protein
MKVKLQKPFKADGWNWPAGKTVDVSNKFAAKLKAGGFLDAPKAAPKAKSTTKKVTTESE